MENVKMYHKHNPLDYGQQVTKECHIEIHIHDHYEIFQALTPNIRYFVEGNAYNLGEGDLIITSDVEIHRPMIRDEGAYGRRFLQFDPEIIKVPIDLTYNPLGLFDNRKPGIGNHLPIPPDKLSLINKYFDDIRDALKEHSPASLYKSRHQLALLLLEMEAILALNQKTKSLIPPMDLRVKNVLSYLDQHFCEPFDLESLCRAHLMDKYYLSHLFKESTGFTLLEYVQSKRIQKAKALLNQPMTISDISQQCGYDDYTNFYKTFKKLVGQSPKVYRSSL